MDCIERVLTVSQQIKAERTEHSILAKLMEEVGELALEVNIQEGLSYKEGDEDGITGEACDVIIAVIDLVRVADPTVELAEFQHLLTRKLGKWAQKTNSRIDIRRPYEPEEGTYGCCDNSPYCLCWKENV